MTNEEAIRNLDTMWKMLTSAYDEIADSFAVAYTMAVDALKAQLPSAQPKPCEDAVSRADAFNAINDYVNTVGVLDGYTDTQEVLRIVKRLPSAQPELPDWVQKVEKYRKSAPSHIHNPLAWALYQTWKEYDR